MQSSNTAGIQQAIDLKPDSGQEQAKKSYEASIAEVKVS
jgi:hypothetical protein